MACKNVCKLCNHLVLSTAIAFTGGNLVVTIPEGSYNNGEKYCIVLAQSIPNTTTITAPVMIQIGTGTTLYPLENRCCAQVTACGVRTRTKYMQPELQQALLVERSKCSGIRLVVRITI